MTAPSSNQALPKSLFRFYMKYAVRENLWLLFWWSLVFIWGMTGRVWWPLSQRWIVSLFENAPSDASTFFAQAIPLIIFIAGMEMSYTLARTLRGMLHSRWEPKTRNRMSDVLLTRVHQQSMSFWTGRMPGQINSQINYVAVGFGAIYEFYKAASLVVMMAANVLLIFSVNFWIAVIFAVVFVIRVAYSALMFRPMNNAGKTAGESASRLSGKTVDSISNYSVVKLFAGGNAERDYLHPYRTRWSDDHQHSFFMQRLFYAVPDLIWDASFGVMLMLSATLFMQGSMSVSDVVYSISIYVSVMGSITEIVDVIPTIVDKTSSASKAYEELSVAPSVVDAPDATDLVVTHGRIEIKNLSFRYGRKWVLRNLNLTIEPGQRVGLVGASGAGKTTLVNLLMRMYDPVSGEILIDGQNIRNVTQDSLRRAIAFIPQEPTMFNRSLYENIAYGRPAATAKDVHTAARQASAHEFIMATENKYDTMVGDRGIKMSGGQRQRVAIARAFLKDAPVLVLDEATSALDSETEVVIQQSFDELATGRTTIAIAHRLSTLRNMDKIVVMSHGKIIEQGAHTKLLRAGGEYARLWAMQSGGFIAE